MKKKRKKNYNVFEGLIGCKVSALFDHPKRGGPIKESYYGEVIGRENGYLIIKPDDLSFATKKNVEMVLLREDKIVSFWIYKND